MGVNRPPQSDATIFGRAAAEVHGLLHAAIREEAVLHGVQIMLEAKGERHAALWRAYCDQRDAATGLLEAWVATASAQTTQAMLTSSSAIDGDMSVLDRSHIKLVDEASLLLVREGSEKPFE